MATRTPEQIRQMDNLRVFTAPVADVVIREANDTDTTSHSPARRLVAAGRLRGHRSRIVTTLPADPWETF